ncbi:MAG: N-carbamoylputrescine amidase [Proteobacteria bacterium]|nr:N-carbamoylputrescine amidase [Pseudomonadota bacterium]MDA1285530.1 N-carbamoylputrescine amidase [Pseudomonadota bacterium]
MRNVTLAATQMACSDVVSENVERGERLVREAAAKGANVILLQELFEGYYFCQDELPEFYARARPVESHPTIEPFKGVARELGVVLPVSFYELAGNARFNSVAIIDADGRNLGVYRKTHIPQGSGYQEKFYFSPGDTGFKVWDTAFGRLGVAICWDQWFPESARAMALQGAEMLFYPTAIGSELILSDWDSAAHWQRVQQGHAAANLMPLVASNRIGTEPGRTGTELTFYGSSFITDATGDKVAEADRTSETVLTHSFDLDELAERRAFWGLFRDRRPEHYGVIRTLDGNVRR